jgi:hypothetical protein
MSSHRRIRPPIFALFVALCLAPGIAVVAAIPWLKQQPDDLVFLLSGIVVAVTITASLVLAIVHDRGMDEWERSNSRFSSYWGDAAGTSLVALLLAAPPFRDWVVSVVANWADASNPNQKLVILAFVFGFMAVVIARVAFMALLSIGWAFWKLRSAREPS